MTFPILKEVTQTLKNWAPQLSSRFKYLEQDTKQYILHGERDTGEKWIDGSTIYEKVYEFGALPNTATKTLDPEILNVRRYLSIRGIATKSTEPTTIPLQLVSSSNETSLFINSSGLIAATTSSDLTSYDEVYIFLKYIR